MAKTYTKLQILRSSYIEDSRPVAIIRLDRDVDHFVGQPVLVRYFEDAAHTKINAVFVLGIKNGRGRDCYRVISLGEYFIVRNVVFSLADVSSLVHGEIYVYQDPNTKEVNKVFEINGVRQIEPIPFGENYIFLSIEDNYIWYLKDGNLRREDDFYSISDIDLKIKELNEKINSLSQGGGPIADQYSLSCPINSNDLVVGVPRDISIKPKLTKGTVDVTSTASFELDGVPISLDPLGEYLIPSISNTTSWRLSAKIDGKFITQITITANFGMYVYCGAVSSSWVVTDSTIKLLSQKKVYHSGEISFTNTLVLQRLAISFPSSLGKLSKVLDDNGFNYIGSYVENSSATNIDGVMYKTYVKEDEVSIMDFKQIYSFKK